MERPVLLKDIVEGMQLQSDEVFSYLNTQTGEIVTVGSEDMDAANNDAHPGGWQEEVIEEARAVLAGAPYVPLPDRFEIHEYSIMVNFAESIEDVRVSGVLQSALRGSGAFRRFKDVAHRLGVIEEWYRYRDKAYEEIAIEWCEDNGIEYRRE